MTLLRGANPVAGGGAALRLGRLDAAERTLDRLEVAFERPQRWEHRYQPLLVLVDLVAVLAASAIALLAHPGRVHVTSTQHPATFVVWFLPAAWLFALWAARAYDPRFLGIGFEEFSRVYRAAVGLLAVIAITLYAIRPDLARGYLLIALPTATALTLGGRYLLRKGLHRIRAAGRCLHRVLVVGHEEAVLDLVAQTRREPWAGMQVVGACLPRQRRASDPAWHGQGDGADRRSGPGSGRLLQAQWPVVGDLEDVAGAVSDLRVDVVAVTASEQMNRLALRRLSWQLQDLGVELMVAPALLDVSGPRISIRPMSGLPLLHVEQPKLSGVRRLLKDGVDRVAAAMLLLLLAPLMVMIAFAIRITTPGPALFRQVRVGRRGGHFTLLKYRTMVQDAEHLRDGLLDRNESADGPLFKIRRDPRVTAVGRWLRRFSLDELPQLLNVLTGSMSLVGPRPPLPSEVARYGDDAMRRLLVKPGLTGLWQISGRADLPWEEAVRLDLRYVENWSLALDAMILWKTVFAVARGRGAY